MGSLETIDVVKTTFLKQALIEVQKHRDVSQEFVMTGADQMHLPGQATCGWGFLGLYLRSVTSDHLQGGLLGKASQQDREMLSGRTEGPGLIS